MALLKYQKFPRVEILFFEINVFTKSTCTLLPVRCISLEFSYCEELEADWIIINYQKY